MVILTPVKNCLLVSKIDAKRFGRCFGEDSDNKKNIKVRWIGNTQHNSVPILDVDSGFKIGMEVSDGTPYSSHTNLGQGMIVANRVIAGHRQELVHFEKSNQSIWMPYQYLRWVQSAKDLFSKGNLSNTQVEFERFKLRILAYAIELWNENTGALSTLDIDPLPHQINLVHHILSSGNLNWLIADDVGLGKTIETGMIIHALRQRKMVKRILLVTPAGLVKQWQEELDAKFKLSNFEILGLDFKIDEPRKWKLHDFVIASIDTLKKEENLQHLLAGGEWDLVIFDEGHKLTRRLDGNTYKSSERFELAHKLRKITPSILLLSATPHQGDQDKFIALLELLRPERTQKLRKLELNPDIIHDMIFRNHKEDVTDSQGNFIFKGKVSVAKKVPTSVIFREFEELLAKYFRQGYSASEKGGYTGRTIGFVMTIYRKLASSSVKAIQKALYNRQNKLEGKLQEAEKSLQVDDNIDMRFEGELEEYKSDLISAKEFFEGELVMLKRLIILSKELVKQDMKMKYFIDEIIEKILSNNSEEKVLIFSEYRQTQLYIKEILEEKYGKDCVSLINGSMSFPERLEAIESFEKKGQFLISTEAGGEGINLQNRCHIMVNYDLPWNPMRLVQRIGRLYRYGQKEKVIIFNLHQEESIDQDLIYTMYQKIDTIVKDLSSVQQSEFHEGLKDEILGAVASEVDVTKILDEAGRESVQRTKERIQEALEKVKSSVEKQQELLSYASTTNLTELDGELLVEKHHIFQFIIGMLKQKNIAYSESKDTKSIRIKFDGELKEYFKFLLGQKNIIEVTLDRDYSRNNKELHMLDLNSPILQYFIEEAKSYAFNGLSVKTHYPSPEIKGIFALLMKWQDSQGVVIKKKLGLSFLDDKSINPKDALDILLSHDEYQEKVLYSMNKEKSDYLEQIKAVNDIFNQHLSQQSNLYLQPNSLKWVACASNFVVDGKQYDDFNDDI